jgi:hypothetical protein
MQVIDNGMSRPTRTFIGILSVLPLAGLFVLLGYLFASFIPHMIELDKMGHEVEAMDVLPSIGILLIIVILFGILHLGLLIYFIIHVIQDRPASSGDKVLWVLLLFFFNPLSFPFYWYFRIWNSVSAGEI